MTDEAAIHELIAASGYDSVTVDYQHGLAKIDNASNHVRAIALSGAVPFARVPSAVDERTIGDLLDYGYMGLICPMIDNADDATCFVAATRYPPSGRRSIGPIPVSLRQGGSYYEAVAPHVLRLAMIETEQAISNLDAILAVDGIDGIYIGPGDLGLSQNRPPNVDTNDEHMLKLMRSIADRARSQGKIAGLHTRTATYANERQADGFNLLTVGIDIPVLVAGFANLVREFCRK